MEKSIKITALVFALALAMLFVAGGCRTNSTEEAREPASERTIRLGFEGGLCQSAIPIAHLNGFLEAEGIDSEIVVTGDLVNSRDSLAAGQIDTVAGMLAGWFVPVSQGIDVRFVLGLHTGCASAYVLADSDINNFEAGQEIAVSGAIGGAFHNIALRYISRDGFAQSDFIFRDFPAAEAVIALQNGTVQVAVIPDHVGAKFVEEGVLRVIRSLDDGDFQEEICCVLGLTGAFIDENPETAAAIARAIYNASRWLDESDDNKTAAVETLIEHGYISAAVDVEYAVGLMSSWRWGLPHSATEQTLITSIEEYQTLGILNPNLDPNLIREQVWRPLGQ